MTAKARILSPDDVIRILKRSGFELVRSKGSHQTWKNRSTGKMTVVPFHKGDLPKGTLAAILKQAGIDKEDLDH